jgi:hypothetical protein
VIGLNLTKGPHVIVRHEIDDFDVCDVWWTVAVQNSTIYNTERKEEELKKQP